MSDTAHDSTDITRQSTFPTDHRLHIGPRNYKNLYAKLARRDRRCGILIGQYHFSGALGEG